MKECMLMQSLIDREKLFIPGGEKTRQRHEPLKFGRIAGNTAPSREDHPAPLQPVTYIAWQFI